MTVTSLRIISFPHEFLDSSPILSDSDVNDIGPTNWNNDSSGGCCYGTGCQGSSNLNFLSASVVHCDRKKTAKGTWVRVGI